MSNTKHIKEIDEILNKVNRYLMVGEDGDGDITVQEAKSQLTKYVEEEKRKAVVAELEDVNNACRILPLEKFLDSLQDRIKQLKVKDIK